MNTVHSCIINTFKCPGCDIKASTRGNLVRHVRESHSEIASSLMIKVMKMSPRESAEKPKELIKPFESVPRLKKNPPPQVGTKQKFPNITQISQRSDDEDDFQPKMKLSKKDQGILKEFLVLDNDYWKTDDPSKIKNQKKKLKVKSKSKTKEISTQTDPIALTLEEILAYCDAVLYKKPDCPKVNAPAVVPIRSDIIQKMSQPMQKPVTRRDGEGRPTMLDMPTTLFPSVLTEPEATTSTGPQMATQSTPVPETKSNSSLESDLDLSSSDEEDTDAWLEI